MYKLAALFKLITTGHMCVENKTIFIKIAYYQANNISRASYPWSSRTRAFCCTRRNCCRRSHRPWNRAIRPFHLEHPGNCLETLCLVVRRYPARQKRAQNARIMTHLTRYPVDYSRSQLGFASTASAAIAIAAVIEKTNDSI